MRPRLRSLSLLVLLLASPLTLAQEVPPSPGNEPGHAGGLSWTPPKSFTSKLTEGLRAATYELPKAKGDAEAPELAVFYFGPGQGGDVEANVRRWSAQLVGKDGKPVKVTTERTKIAGFQVTLVKGAGTYRSGGMGLSPVIEKPGFRLLGAIVEGPEGPVFFKLTGPAKGVTASEADFKKLLGSLAAMG